IPAGRRISPVFHPVRTYRCGEKTLLRLRTWSKARTAPRLEIQNLQTRDPCRQPAGASCRPDRTTTRVPIGKSDPCGGVVPPLGFLLGSSNVPVPSGFNLLKMI